MKPETKRTATVRRRGNNAAEGSYSPFNLSTLKHAIEAVDAAKEKEKTINLASLSAALSAASRKMKQTENSQRKRARDAKNKNKKKLMMVGMKPETNAELQRWFSNFDESFKQSLTKKKVTPKTTLMEPQICEFNTDFTLHHCAEAFM